VRLYFNLHQDLFNKELKQKEERGMRGGLTFCKNCNITIRIFGIKKLRKRQEQGAAMFGAAALFYPIPGSRALKRGGSQNGDALN
jgi:hypothetical protein